MANHATRRFQFIIVHYATSGEKISVGHECAHVCFLQIFTSFECSSVKRIQFYIDKNCIRFVTTSETFAQYGSRSAA